MVTLKTVNGTLTVERTFTMVVREHHSDEAGHFNFLRQQQVAYGAFLAYRKGLDIELQKLLALHLWFLMGTQYNKYREEMLTYKKVRLRMKVGVLGKAHIGAEIEYWIRGKLATKMIWHMPFYLLAKKKKNRKLAKLGSSKPMTAAFRIPSKETKAVSET